MSVTTVLTPYAEMVLHKRMQTFVRWKATKIHLEIPSPLPMVIACGHAIAASRHLNIHELPDMCVMKYIIIALIFVTYYSDRKT
uniref:Uncharacterized protein n=1 Tax=Lactuca sativa TaxID=4236 RepID=A0A9R1VMH1_LACSA|nr:hypothetical protein LSAT_V11C400168850 [Lactuca sativa]